MEEPTVFEKGIDIKKRDDGNYELLVFAETPNGKDQITVDLPPESMEALARAALTDLGRDQSVPNDNQHIKLLSECRDAFPIPAPGSRLELYWVAAMGDPEAVPAYLKAIAEQEPVMIYCGDCVIDCGDTGHHHMEMLKMIPAGTALYTHPYPKGRNAVAVSQGSTGIERWDEMIRKQFPDSIQKYWSERLQNRYMAREIDALRAALSAKNAADHNH